MINEQKKTDEEVFTSALAFQSNEEQDDYVATTCVEDTSQLERVLGLLASHRNLAKVQTTFVLDMPDIVCNELMAEESITIGEYIGPYRIMQLLGEGGMGLVYQAEQVVPIRRRVALKLLKPGMDSQKVLARFELERQALAGMEHPGITKILDAGLADSGRPYFVMELVKGNAITEYCRTHQLKPLDCIHLMIQVCSAFQHAHQRGIIHRDIKPSNVLVAHGDSGPSPKIIDFGIAKVVNESMGHSDHFTLHGEMVGTPEYMSPEQALSSAEGVDTRTDVYSLGVLLYELLTGETPLAGVSSEVGLTRLSQLFRDSRMELPSQRVMRRRATNTSHETPNYADEGKPERFLQGDVDCIVMKALSREPNDRYQSVSELKRDLERFVAGMPIEAAPPSFFYQLKKLINRHRVIASVASTACIFVVVASAIAIWFGLVANDRLQDVLDMQSELKIERDRAVDAERRARLLAQTYLAPAVLDQSIRRFCIEHWDQLVDINPKLKSLPIPKEKEFLHAEIQITIFDSNLLDPDERLIVLGESKWLVKILSDISKKDVGPLLMVAPQFYTIDETAPVETHASTPSGESNPVTAQPAPVGAGPAINTSFFTDREVSYKFPIAAKKAYLSIFCEELRAIDSQLPVVADAEDSLGLCLMDMQRPDLAIARFRESIRIRESYPELLAQTLQTQLFTADCLKRLDKHAESKLAVDKVRADLTANSQTLDANSIEHLNKTSNAIETGKASP
ncbi:MAG: serine/threonine protein kinase [Pirellula sp.]|jgi:serine/threonine protein kinase|nr:serine/threonine protein kinase [Pirellula sp.]